MAESGRVDVGSLIDPPDNDSHVMCSVFELLKKGEEQIISHEYKDVVFLLGNSGSGKSTLAQWLVDYSSKLIAEEVEDSGDHLILDRDGKIGTTSHSHTMFPLLVEDKETKTAYYDCPGFNDTRSASHDIVSTYFIKKVLDHAERVKLVFVVNFSSVRKGENRRDFMELIQHATDLVKDFNKYKCSVAMVVSKVDNNCTSKGVLVGDVRLKKNIANFIQNIMDDTNKNNSLSKNGIAMLDSLTIFEVDKFKNISIFRRPDDSGPLNELPLLSEEKTCIRDMINALKFTQKSNEDFGFTISDKSKVVVLDEVEEIHKIFVSKVRDVAHHMRKHFELLVDQACRTIISLKERTEVADKELLDLLSYKSQIEKGHSAVLDLMNFLANNTDPEGMSDKIVDIVKEINIKMPDNLLLDVSNHRKYFSFLELVSEQKLGWSMQWAELFESLEAYLAKSESTIQGDVMSSAKSLISRMSLECDLITKEVEKQLRDLTSVREVKTAIDELDKTCKVILNIKCMLENDQQIAKITSWELASSIADDVRKLGFQLPHVHMKNILEFGKYYDILLKTSEMELSYISSVWLNSFKPLISYIEEAKLWYVFLNNLYITLSQYGIQKKLIIRNFLINRRIDSGNLITFLGEISNFEVMNCEWVAKTKITEAMLEELNLVLGLTTNGTETKIDGSNLLICGFFIRSDVVAFIAKVLFHRFNSIEIIAFNTFFIDCDLSWIGKNVSIVAPKWEILGNRTIKLVGVCGEPMSQAKVEEDGMQGRPGGCGGSFLGVGEEFVNGENLTVMSIGGEGGMGQDGGDGCNGRDGESATMSDISTGTDGLYGGGFEVKEQYDRSLFSPYNVLKRGVAGGGTGACVGRITVTPFGVGVGAAVGTVSGTVLGVIQSAKRCYKYTLFGKPGARGGNGANGGRGGEGGRPGNIEILCLKNQSQIKIEKVGGRIGKKGIGGNGGIGGKFGNSLVVWKGFDNKWDQLERVQNDERNQSGNRGLDGVGEVVANQEIMAVAPQPVKVILENFTYLARLRLHDCYSCRFMATLENFLSQLNDL